MTAQRPGKRQLCSLLKYLFCSLFLFQDLFERKKLWPCVMPSAFQPLPLNHKEVIMFSCACALALPLFSAPEQLSAGPDTVMTGATVLTAAAHIHVSLPHLFKVLVLTDSYHMLAVCKLYQRDGNGRVTELCNRSRQLCVFLTHAYECHSLLTRSPCYKKPISCENTCTGRAYMLWLNSCCAEVQLRSAGADSSALAIGCLPLS